MIAACTHRSTRPAARPTSMTCRTERKPSRRSRRWPTSGRTRPRGEAGLDHPQFPAGVLRHPLGGPHRVVDDVHAGVLDAGQRQQVITHIGHHVGGHRAAERRQRHLHVDAVGLDRDSIDEPEVDDVYRNLRVEALAQHLDDVFRLEGGALPHLGRGCEIAHGASSGKPASFHALVPPRKLTTSLTPSATAISEATAERSPTWQTKIVPSLNVCPVGLDRIELRTTWRAPGRWPLFHSQSSRTSTISRSPSSISLRMSSIFRSRNGVSSCVLLISYSSSSPARP